MSTTTTNRPIDERFRHVFKHYGISEKERSDNLIACDVGKLLAGNMREPEKGCAGFVYVIKDGEFYKIGIAVDPKARITLLQTGNPRKLTLLHYWQSDNPRKEEAKIHKRLRRFRVSGEWFKLPDWHMAMQ
jgi:hypothetical protein